MRHRRPWPWKPAAVSHAAENGGEACLSKSQSLPYRFTLESREHPWRLSPARLISRLMEDLQRDAGGAHIALQFHLALADGIIRVCERLAARESLDTAALSGGCFQNRLLLRLVAGGLRQRGITVLIHKQVPPNDGGISLGQAAIAASR